MSLCSLMFSLLVQSAASCTATSLRCYTGTPITPWHWLTFEGWWWWCVWSLIWGCWPPTAPSCSLITIYKSRRAVPIIFSHRIILPPVNQKGNTAPNLGKKFKSFGHMVFKTHHFFAGCAERPPAITAAACWEERWSELASLFGLKLSELQSVAMKK